MMVASPLEIALAFRDTDGSYIRHVATMVASVLACTERPLRIHVLHDETLTHEGREKLRTMTQAAGRDMHFHHLEPHTCLPGVDEASPILRPLTFATLYRLFLPALPGVADCDRIIYLDTDMVVDCDLGEMWDINLGPALLGAVPDPCLCGALRRGGDAPRDVWARDVARYTLRQGIPMTRYFNAGVLLLDIAAIRARGLFDDAARLVLDNPQLLHPDQDALNKIFFGLTAFLPKKFNYILHTDDVRNITQGIWHYSGPRKPWREPMPKADRYHYYLAHTPWGQGVVP